MGSLGCETGQVVGLEDRYALVELEENEACKGCGARALCLPGDSKKRLRVLNSIEAEVGDGVALELDHSQQLKMAAMHYGLPLVGFVLGVLLGALFFSKPVGGFPVEIGQFLCGVVLMMLCGVRAHYWSKRFSGEGVEFAQMTRKI
jgi:sigma-E factor negative regulatory protein RseC